MAGLLQPDLLRQVAERGDVEAFRKLFQQFAPRLKSYMMRKGADAATAEELAQETLLTVWRKARLYSRDKGSEATWIFTIARNLRIDRLRREMTWQALPEGRESKPPTTPRPMRQFLHANANSAFRPHWRHCRLISTRLSYLLSSMDFLTARSPSSCGFLSAR